MMEDAGAQVASSIVIPQPHAGMFYNVHPVAKKRGSPFNPISFVHQNPSDNWNPMSWDWDSTSFVAKQLQSDGILVGSDPRIQQDLPRSVELQNTSVQNAKNLDRYREDNENLRLKLGAGDGAGPSDSSGVMDVLEPQAVPRPNKRVRAGSPGGANYPRCQVDNCKEDLSTAKDYHRRHKVCEVHSKASKALVGKQMQRFCQQCSRFHPLSEFDEGKRSCRRRLAGHNRRRRKTQPEDTTQRLSVPDNRNNIVNCDLDVVSLLAVLAHAQGNIEDMNGKFSTVPNKDQLIQILNKINSLPLPADVTTKLPVAKSINASIHNLSSSGNQNQVVENASSPSTLDLLAVLSATSGAPSSDAVELQSQPSTEESGSEKSRSPCVDQDVSVNLHRGRPTEEVLTMGERSGSTYHYPLEDVDCHVQETPSLPLQLFSSSPEDDSGRKLQSGGKTCFSSGGSNPSEGRSPVSSPPVVHDLFPLHTSKESMKHENLSSRGDMKASISNNCNTSLQLFGYSVRSNENGSIANSPYHAGYSSSSGSDHSPSRLLSDVQDRTGRIVFKLFEKDPSHLPGSLRAQIFNWLSTSPSEMESYIRPGCVVLSIYLSMPSFAWEKFEKNLLHYVKSLVRGVDVEFWRNGRFLIHTDRQMASYKDGSIRLCKSWSGWSTPELIWVSPVAVVGGQETSLLLRGRKLTTPGTKIHCTHPAGCNASLVPALLHQDSATDELVLGSLKVNLATPKTLGRCFIEVENNIRGTCFPVIVADAHICQELRLLEPDVGSAEVHDGVNHIQNRDGPMSREEALHFLNELGWLFQKKYNSTLLMSPEYKLSRLQFLLIFSVECDFCALVETLLGILVEYNLGRDNLARESLEMLAESHLLNKAVKRKCRRMVDLLIRYSVFNSTDNSEMFIFLPNMAGPGGVTPLHLAACTTSADDIVDALTSDPEEIGLLCWNSLLDSNGFSPYAYALMRNNISYNSLVARKYAKRKMSQVSISVGDEIVPLQLVVNKEETTFSNLYQDEKSCSRCALVAGYSKKFPNSQGLLQPPFIHSLLVVAAVCVCVCVFLRVLPYLSSVAPFAWENLDYGAM